MENTQTENQLKTQWYHYVLAFFAGIFFINVLPHYINGITGRPFPTPFADPPGKGLSSPVMNVVWATINFLIGFAIFYSAKITKRSKWIWIAVFIGALAMSFNLAIYFGKHAGI